MVDERFSAAEDDYYLLKEELAAGRITPEQFQASLRKLMFRDEQGRTWALGSQSGKWHRFDGKAWVQADPFVSSAEPAERSPGRSPLLAFGATSALILLALCVFLGAWFLASPLIDRVGAMGQSVGSLLPSRAFPLSTATPRLKPADSTPTPASSADVDTATPMVVPSATAQPTSAVTEIPTSTPVATAIEGSPTSAAESSPGLYVSGIAVIPPQPRRGQGVTFLATFVNSTGQGQTYTWLVQIYDADNNRRFGETLVQTLTIPPGTNSFPTADNWSVVGKGGCKSFYAQAESQNSDHARIPFPAPGGGVISQGFTVC